MRRFLSILRKPVVVLPLAFLASSGAFWWLLPYEPNFEFRTLQADEPIEPISTKFDAVADEGNEVVIRNQYQLETCGIALKVSAWNARQGKMIASKRNFDPQILHRLLLPSDPKDNSDIGELPEQYMFVHGEEQLPSWLILDDVAWKVFHQRLLQSRSQCVAQQKAILAPLWKEEYGLIEKLDWDLFPWVCRFGSEQQFFCYGTYNGVAQHNVFFPNGVPERDNRWINGVAVDDWRTGRRIALVPIDPGRLFASIFISPNGRTALITTISEAKIRTPEQFEQFDLWDLVTSQRLARLRISAVMENSSAWRGVRFAPNGDKVFYQGSNQVVWWDATNGNTLGLVAGVNDIAVLDGGRTLVTCSDKPEDHTLRFWDTKTGKQLATKELAEALSYSDRVNVQSFAENSRYIAFRKFHPTDTAPPATVFEKWLNRLIPSKKNNKPEGIFLFDGIDRREVANLPGNTATFSPNGRWLATIDGDGIVRVWELPLRRPWLRIFGYAAITTLACTVLFLLARWPFRRYHPA